MSYELRDNRDAFTDAIDAVSASSTVLTSPIFASLPINTFSAGRYLPCEIVDDNTGKREVVWITGTDGTSTATVLRGQEGTDQQTWETQSTIRCSPTIRESVLVYGSAAELPYANLHVGARYILAGNRVVREKTVGQGGLPSVRMDPNDVGRNVNDTSTLPNQEFLGRFKVVTLPPIVTPSTGVIDILWNGQLPATTALSVWTITTPIPMNLVSAAWFAPYLLGADSSWTGIAAPVSVWAPGEQRISMKFFGPTGAVFANKQVRGSLVLMGM